MGACLSSDRSEYESQKPTTAKVISLKGNLMEYKVPLSASQVLQDESFPSSCFLCNSDCLFFDDYIPALDSDEELEANQIYFVLPTSKLQYKLSASDMAALAVKASLALQNSSKKGSYRRKRARISAVLPVNQNQNVSKYSISLLEGAETKVKASVKTNFGPDISISRSRSVRRLQRFTSRRAKLAVRSFRLRLATVYEGKVM